MKWLTTKTWEYKKQAKECWHYWFVWYPVTIQKYPDGARIRIWFTTVLRKGEWWSDWGDSGWNYDYKEVTPCD